MLPAACGANASTSTRAAPSEFPEGVYRADVPAEFLIEKGMDAPTAHELGGIWTMKIENGRWRGHTEESESNPSDCGGTYAVARRRITLRHDVAQCGEPAGAVVMSARWKLEDGELTFFDIHPGRPIEWGSKPWTKIE